VFDLEQIYYELKQEEEDRQKLEEGAATIYSILNQGPEETRGRRKEIAHIVHTLPSEQLKQIFD